MNQCKCGCGVGVGTRTWAPGHDLRALLKLVIEKWGSIDKAIEALQSL